jgi:hypothetical protein
LLVLMYSSVGFVYVSMIAFTRFVIFCSPKFQLSPPTVFRRAKAAGARTTGVIHKPSLRGLTFAIAFSNRHRFRWSSMVASTAVKGLRVESDSECFGE